MGRTQRLQDQLDRLRHVAESVLNKSPQPEVQSLAALAKTVADEATTLVENENSTGKDSPARPEPDLYEIAPVAYVTLDTSDVIVRINSAAAEMFKNANVVANGMADRPTVDLIGRSLEDLIHSDDQARYRNFRQRMINDDRQTVDIRLLRQEDQSEYYVRMYGVFIESQEERFGDILLAIIDISVLKRKIRTIRARHTLLNNKAKEQKARIRNADEQLRATLRSIEDTRVRLEQSEQRYDIMMKNSTVGIAVIDDGKVILVNDQLANILGYETDQLVGSQFVQYIHTDDQARVQEITDRHQKDREAPNQYEFRIVNADGATRWMRSHAVVVRWDENLSVLNFMNDISAEKETEERLTEYRVELERERSALAEKNIALRELISQLEEQRKHIHRQITENLEQTVIPLLDRTQSVGGDLVRSNLEQLKSELQDLTSPFMSDMRQRLPQMSPRQREICRLIKQGKSTKEIAESLNIADSTVQKHRELIRKKLGLSHSNVNLITYLQSLSDDQ